MDIIKYDLIRTNEDIKTTLILANEQMDAIGYTEHGLRHATIVAERAKKLLIDLNYPEETSELAAIAGLLHDIGNAIARHDHPNSSALIAMRLLQKMDMPFKETMLIAGAIGNHEEPYGSPTNAIGAALIIADKSDVHKTRVQNYNKNTFDIHDRVNYSVTESNLLIDHNDKYIVLDLTTDDQEASVMEYFEIFLSRMQICKAASSIFDFKFKLIINGVNLS